MSLVNVIRNKLVINGVRCLFPLVFCHSPILLLMYAVFVYMVYTYVSEGHAAGGAVG